MERLKFKNKLIYGTKDVTQDDGSKPVKRILSLGFLECLRVILILLGLEATTSAVLLVVFLLFPVAALELGAPLRLEAFLDALAVAVASSRLTEFAAWVCCSSASCFTPHWLGFLDVERPREPRFLLDTLAEEAAGLREAS